MRWSARALTGAVLAAISCLSGGACGGDNNKDVSGAYEISLEAGAVRALLYLVRSPNAEYFAVLDGTTCALARTADELILNACSLLGRGRSAARYVSFRIERDSAGDLATLSALDQTNDVWVEGQLERSRHAPVLRGLSVQVSPSSTTRPRLPWDAIAIDFGEGVLIDEATLQAAIEVEASGGDPVEARWSYRSIDVPSSPRQLTLSASATLNWFDLIGQVITISLPAGTPDSAGKTTSNFMDVDFQLPRMAAPARAWELLDSSELTGLVRWGPLTLVRETAECPGSCLHAGETISPCAEPGFAGQLDASEAAKLVVRVRTITNKRLTAPIELGIFLGEPAASDAGRSSTRLQLMDSGEPQDSLFRNVELPLSASQRRARLPFELRVLYGCRSGAQGQNAAPADASVLIERIAAE